MALTDINSTIASLATPGGITVLERGPSQLIAGRPSSPAMTPVAVADVVWAPDAGGRTAALQSGIARPTESIVVYARRELVPPMREKQRAWWLLAGGRFFEVTSVEPWTPGGFWVARATLVEDTRSVGVVGFASISAAAAAVPATARAAALAAMSAWTTKRSMRFVAPAGGGANVVAFAWPSTIEQLAEVPVFRAVNADGEDVVVAATISATVDGFVAVLPRVVSPDGMLRYEVT